jgi:hypothetical protein
MKPTLLDQLLLTALVVIGTDKNDLKRDALEGAKASAAIDSAKAAPDRPKSQPDHPLQGWPCGPMRHGTRQLSGERAHHGAWHTATGLVLRRRVAGFVSAVDTTNL